MAQSDRFSAVIYSAASYQVRTIKKWHALHIAAHFVMLSCPETAIHHMSTACLRVKGWMRSSPYLCLLRDRSAGRPCPGSLLQRTPSGGSSLRSPRAGHKDTS